MSRDCCRKRHFFVDKNCLLDHSSVFYAQFLNNESRGRRLNRFKRFKLIDSDNTFHNANFTTLYTALSSYQTALPCARNSPVSDWITRVNPQFFIKEILNIWTAMIFRIFRIFIQQIAKSLVFFVPSARYSPFAALERMFASSL